MGLDCRYQYANRRICELFGRPLEAVVGHDDGEFFDPDTSDNLRKNDRRVLEQGERLVDEEINTTADGVITSVFFSIKIPLREPDGSIYALCGISTDITQRRQTELELEKYRYHLKSLVASRTTELLLRPDEVLSGILDAPVLEVAHDALGVLLKHRHMGDSCFA